MRIFKSAIINVSGDPRDYPEVSVPKPASKPVAVPIAPKPRKEPPQKATNPVKQNYKITTDECVQLSDTIYNNVKDHEHAFDNDHGRHGKQGEDIMEDYWGYETKDHNEVSNNVPELKDIEVSDVGITDNLEVDADQTVSEPELEPEPCTPTHSNSLEILTKMVTRSKASRKPITRVSQITSKCKSNAINSTASTSSSINKANIKTGNKHVIKPKSRSDSSRSRSRAKPGTKPKPKAMTASRSGKTPKRSTPQRSAQGKLPSPMAMTMAMATPTHNSPLDPVPEIDTASELIPPSAGNIEDDFTMVEAQHQLPLHGKPNQQQHKGSSTPATVVQVSASSPIPEETVATTSTTTTTAVVPVLTAIADPVSGFVAQLSLFIGEQVAQKEAEAQVAQRETAAMEAVFREFAAERLRIREEVVSAARARMFPRTD
jgi:hypothetical protein